MKDETNTEERAFWRDTYLAYMRILANGHPYMSGAGTPRTAEEVADEALAEYRTRFSR